MVPAMVRGSFVVVEFLGVVLKQLAEVIDQLAAMLERYL